MIMNKRNLDSADVLKYIMSILIVATHSSLFSGYITPLVRLAVPAFFMLSGYFFFSKLNVCQSKEDKKMSLKKSVKRNLQLYGFWFTVLLPVTLYVRDYISLGPVKGILSLVRDFFFSSTFQSSWYIVALVIGLIILFFLSQKLSDFALITVGILFYIPCLLSSNYLFVASSGDTIRNIYHTFTDIFSLPCRNFFVAILYLALGKILAESREEKKPKKDGLIFAGCFVLMIAEYLTLKYGGAVINNTDCYVMLPVTAYYLCKWVLSLDIRCTFAPILRNISTISYCSHMAVFMVTGKLFKVLHLPDWQNILLFAVTLIATQALSLVIIKLSEYKKLRILRYSY